MNDNVPSQDEFLAAFGVGSTPPAEEPATTTEPPEGTEPPAQEPEGTEPPPESTPPAQPDKTAVAFAQMRTENKKLQTLMKGVAQVLGVQEVNDPQKMLEAIQNLTVTAQAKQQQTTPEILTRLHQLEERDQEFTQSQLRNAAYLEFQKVKDNFKLTNQELESFADVLVQKGMNPFEQPVDVVKEYVAHNHAKLIADAEARGAQREAERAAKANAQGSTPNKKTGQGETSAENISSVSELNNWFDKQK